MSALDLSGLTVRFGEGSGAMTAVDDVDLSIEDGGVLGLVGESGSGKSTLGRAIAGLVPISDGRILIGGQQVNYRSRRSWSEHRVQMIFQDPLGSLDPRMPVGQSIAEGVAAGGLHKRGDRSAEVSRLLELVSLNPKYASVRPSKLSGGQCQRVALARALGAGPAVLIADEITSALDVSVQGSVLNVLREVRNRLNITMLFISHNLAVVSAVCDEIAVMYTGRIIERAPTAELISRPRHPYTRALLDAVPVVGQPAKVVGASTLDVEPPDPHSPPTGCRFHPRCPIGPTVHAERTVCIEQKPLLLEVGPRSFAACHFADEVEPIYAEPKLDS